MMDKKAMDMWQLILIILALVSLIVVLIMIGFANSEVSSFTDWLGGIT